MVLHVQLFCRPPAHTRQLNARHTHIAVRCESQKDSPGTSKNTEERPASFSLSDPAETVVWGGRLPSTRRLVVGTSTAAAVALIGNLGGITSWLLQQADGGRAASSLRLDVLYPVNGSKRSVDYQYGFEFNYPSKWLGDQTVAARQAQRREREFALDPPAARRGRDIAEPVAAYGPPGSTGEENVSVIVASIQPGFSLPSLGTPTEFAETFLRTTVAPEGSGLTAALVNAQQRTDAAGLYYQIEFTVEGPRFSRHNVSVICARNDRLYTFNAQCPAQRWEQDGKKLLQSAASFRVLA